MWERAVLAFGVIAASACYRPAAEPSCAIACNADGPRCPDGLTCGSMGRCESPGGPSCAALLDAAGGDGPASDGSVGDAMPDAIVDAMVDAPAATCMPSGFSDVPLSSGWWMVADRPSGRAAKLLSPDIAVHEGGVFDTNIAQYEVIFTATPPDTYDAPRLSPGGAELYFRVNQSGIGVSFARATRLSQGAWSLSNFVVFKDGVGTRLLSDQDVMSPPTVSPTPRRTVLSSVGSMTEYIEINAGEWQRVAINNFGIGNVTFLGEAALSPDGLRMVFIGQRPGDLIAAYVVTRASVNLPFTDNVYRLPTDPGISVGAPYLTANCEHLYYTDRLTGVVHHVSY